MRRRVILAGIATSVSAMSGCGARILPGGEDESRADYQDDANVVYEHGDLELDLLQEAVHVGDTVAFEVTNTSDSMVNLGCNIHWALQTYSDDAWRHVTWTADRYYQACYTGLSPERSKVVTVTMTESELERQADDLDTDIGPGRYRFVLLGPSPFLAHGFTVLDPE